MIQNNDPEMIAKLQEGKRKAALYRITDPLWQAIHYGNRQETARLQHLLADLVEKDKQKQNIVNN